MVDAAEIVEDAPEAGDAVGVDAVVALRGREVGPAPAEADAGVGQVAEVVVLDDRLADVSGGDAEAAPVLVGAVVDQVVGDAQARANLAVVGGIVGEVGLFAAFHEFAQLEPVAGDVEEDAALDGEVAQPAPGVEPGRGQALETAALEAHRVRRLHPDRPGRTTDPGLVFEALFLRGAGREHLVGLGHVEPGLVGNVSGERGTHPRRMVKMDTAELDVADRPFERADDLQQGLLHRHDGARGGHGFARARPVVDPARGEVVEPLAGGVEQAERVLQEKGRPIGLGHDRRGPGVLELDAALGLVETHPRRVALGQEFAHPQEGDFPLLVDDKLQRGEVAADAGQGGNGGEFGVFVPGQHAAHLAGVWRACADGLFPVDPELAKLARASADERRVGHP